jgi:hypothetical protein
MSKLNARWKWQNSVQIIFDVVDLLQLQEVWSRRPLLIASSRLERREPAIPCAVNFSMELLVPRLARLKISAAWQRRGRLSDDPARIPLGSMPEECLSQLFPETGEDASRHSVFYSAYSRFVFARYQGDITETAGLLGELNRLRGIEDSLDKHNLPLPGSQDWIPPDITDDIRGLDRRYDSSQPGAPATYVIAEPFWTLLVKATPQELDAAAGLHVTNWSEKRDALAQMVDVSQMWSRSPSVVGLCYQQEDI